MGAHGYAELARHVGHPLEFAVYGTDDAAPENLAIECLHCSEVVCDADRDPHQTDSQRCRYEQLLRHRGHRLECVSRPMTGTVAVICRACGRDLLAFDEGER